MPRVTYIEFNGTRHLIEAQIGASVMETAVDNGVPGIDADCGGACSCATCHVILPDEWMETLGPPCKEEALMLDLHPERTANSRLSCQIDVAPELDGLVVQLPEFQM